MSELESIFEIVSRIKAILGPNMHVLKPLTVRPSVYWWWSHIWVHRWREPGNKTSDRGAAGRRTPWGTPWGGSGGGVGGGQNGRIRWNCRVLRTPSHWKNRSTHQCPILHSTMYSLSSLRPCLFCKITHRSSRGVHGYKSNCFLNTSQSLLWLTTRTHARCHDEKCVLHLNTTNSKT